MGKALQEFFVLVNNDVAGLRGDRQAQTAQEHPQPLLLPVSVNDGLLGLRAAHVQVAKELHGVPLLESAHGLAMPAVEVQPIAGQRASPMVPRQGRAEKGGLALHVAPLQDERAHQVQGTVWTRAHLHPNPDQRPCFFD